MAEHGRTFVDFCLFSNKKMYIWGFLKLNYPNRFMAAAYPMPTIKMGKRAYI
jgi:hypothetical protein